MILAAYYHPILATLFAFAAVILIGVILLQRGKGVGLSGAFGGAGGHTAFGAKTGDVLTWATVAGAVVVLTFAVILNYVFVPPTPFATPPSRMAPLTAPPTPGPGTPAAPPGRTAVPTEGAWPAAPVETTPPVDAEAPSESASPDEKPPPTEPGGTP